MRKTESFQEQSALFAALFVNYSQTQGQFFSTKINLDEIFFILQQEWPRHFARLMFDTNGHTPFSEDVRQIIFTLKLSGLLSWDGRWNINIDGEGQKTEQELKDISWITPVEFEIIARRFCELINQKKSGVLK